MMIDFGKLLPGNLRLTGLKPSKAVGSHTQYETRDLMSSVASISKTMIVRLFPPSYVNLAFS